MDRTLIHGAGAFLDLWDDESPVIEAHTSGSTGVPKVIWLPKEHMRRSAQATNSFFGIDSRSTLVCPLSVDYIAGKMMVVRAIEAGAELWMLTPHRESILSELPDSVETIDLLPIVPAQLEPLLRSDRAARVKNVIIGGSPMTDSQEAMAADAPFSAFATYGMTETCSHVALRRIGHDGQWLTPMPGVRTALDGRGCLIVDGMVTNDIVELRGDGRFRWLGRADNVIITGGLKVAPEEMERLISGGMAVVSDARFYLTSRSSELWGEEVVMVVDREVDRSAVDSICRRLLPRHAVPKDVIVDPGMEFTASGKLRRRRL